MRINHLRMKNFAPIYYSLDKGEIYLDYTSEAMRGKTIFIFIGKMGSCKTFLLGHHQPFATLGTLDTRNSEDMILPDKRGIKEIQYQDGDTIYDILHVFMPFKDTHSVKSYIKKNGVELNPNGNGNSFRAIVEAEFGLDQNYLKLFRIGANVTNLPDMSSAERKAFIASMLSDTETYVILYKRIGERVRSLNAQLNMLLGRLKAISDRTEEQLTKDLEAEEEFLNDAQSQYAAIAKEQYRIEGEMRAILGDRTKEQFETYVEEMKIIMNLDEHKVHDLEEKLANADDLPEPTEFAAKISSLRTKCEMRTAQILELSKLLDGHSSELTSVRDKLSVMASAEHVESLRRSYEELMSKRESYAKQLEHFTYTGTIGSIDHLVTEATILDGMISQLNQYDVESLREILSNPGKALLKAKNETARLLKERNRAQQEMSNLAYLGNYVPTHAMMRPPDCPTKDCPFFKYHPVTEKKNSAGTILDKRYLDYRNQISAIQAKIDHYEPYPIISARVKECMIQWRRMHAEMSDLDLILIDDIEGIITNPTQREWFNHSRANHIRELCALREKYYELTQQVSAMRDELSVYELSDRESLEKDRARLEELVSKESQDLTSLEAQNRDDQDTVDVMEEQYTTLTSMELLKLELKELTVKAEQSKNTYEKFRDQLEAVGTLENNMGVLSGRLINKRDEYNTYERSCNELKRKISDMQYTRNEYNRVKSQHALIKDIMDATSPKDGIPLAFVKLFLMDCKDAINDLISDVFADHVEIQDFHIPETGSDFFIPYRKNGKLISDVNKASQGERAIISLALAFALIRQASFTYNIMLLDEMDGPLYKEDRNKFITILMKQLRAIHAEQVFLVSHNNTFDGFNVGIIMTTDEVVDESALTSVIRV